MRQSEILTGRYADALPPAEEAVAIRCEFASANRDRFGRGYANALDNLGVRLSEPGRLQEATVFRPIGQLLHCRLRTVPSLIRAESDCTQDRLVLRPVPLGDDVT